MLKSILVISSLLFSLTFIQCKDHLTSPNKNVDIPELTSSEKKLSSSADIFGIKLFKKISDFDKGKNIFISPLSVSIALGMTLNGANGATYDSIKSVLELNGLTAEEINKSYKNLSAFLTQVDPKVIFNIANSIWYKNSFSFKQDFINTNKNYFNAEVSGLDFNDPASVNVINSWVSANTKGKIDKILDSISPQEIMFLINAIYFKGDWRYQFDKSKTKNDFFTKSDGSKVPVEMMKQENDFNYFTNDLFQAVDLPYGDSSFFMTIFLPNVNQNINTIVDQFNKENWEKWLNSFQVKEGTVSLPKFELKYEIGLKDILSSMGMDVAFTGFADFTNMFEQGGICISRVKHKTFVKVDEEGTEAAAVTVVGIWTTSVGNHFYIKMDRPFIFVIRERHSNNILFIGILEDPAKT